MIKRMPTIREICRKACENSGSMFCSVLIWVLSISLRLKFIISTRWHSTMYILGTIKREIEQCYFIAVFMGFLGLFVSVLSTQAAFSADSSVDPGAMDIVDSRALEYGVFKNKKWDHNFALLIGRAWGQSIVDQTRPIQRREFRSEAVYTKFQYCFHLPLYRGFGYVLGTSFGYYLEQVVEDERTFRRVKSYHFPGIHLGLVYNFSPTFRVLGGLETYLERIDKLTILSKDQATGTEVENNLSLTLLPNFDWILASDVFYSGGWGIRLEWHTRRVISTPPSASGGQVVGANLTKRDTWIGLGLIFHTFAT